MTPADHARARVKARKACAKQVDLINHTKSDIMDAVHRLLKAVTDHTAEQTANNMNHDATHRETWSWDLAGPIVQRETALIKRKARVLSKQLTKLADLAAIEIADGSTP